MNRKLQILTAFLSMLMLLFFSLLMSTTCRAQLLGEQMNVVTPTIEQYFRQHFSLAIEQDSTGMRNGTKEYQQYFVHQVAMGDMVGEYIKLRYSLKREGNSWAVTAITCTGTYSMILDFFIWLYDTDFRSTGNKVGLVATQRYLNEEIKLYYQGKQKGKLTILRYQDK